MKNEERFLFLCQCNKNLCFVSDHLYIVMDQNVFEYNENDVLYYAEQERERKKWLHYRQFIYVL